MLTGNVEIEVDTIELLGACDVLPIQVAGAHEYPEEMRLRFRYLALRRDRLHRNIVLRSRVISRARSPLDGSPDVAHRSRSPGW